MILRVRVCACVRACARACVFWWSCVGMLVLVFCATNLHFLTQTASIIVCENKKKIKRKEVKMFKNILLFYPYLPHPLSHHTSHFLFLLPSSFLLASSFPLLFLSFRIRTMSRSESPHWHWRHSEIYLRFDWTFLRSVSITSLKTNGHARGKIWSREVRGKNSFL